MTIEQLPSGRHGRNCWTTLVDVPKHRLGDPAIRWPNEKPIVWTRFAIAPSSTLPRLSRKSLPGAYCRAGWPLSARGSRWWVCRMPTPRWPTALSRPSLRRSYRLLRVPFKVTMLNMVMATWVYEVITNAQEIEDGGERYRFLGVHRPRGCRWRWRWGRPSIRLPG